MFFSVPEAQSGSGETEVHPADMKGMVSTQVGSRQLLVLEVNISRGSSGKNPP